MKDEILAGLRNALARGQSLDEAVRTFLNAGYNPAEVQAAAQMISSPGSVNSVMSGGPAQPQPASTRQLPMQQQSRMIGSVRPPTATAQGPPAPPAQQGTQKLPQPYSTPHKGGGNKILVVGLLVILLIVLLSALGFLLYYVAF